MPIDNDLSKKIQNSINAKKKLIKISKEINFAIKKIHNSLKNGKKILLCGNGGSAADAQHLSAEFLIRLRPNINRNPLPAISLSLDTSTLTACGNDYDFNYIFSRNLDALGSKGDILIIISTSGNSKNILEVLKKAKQKKIFSIGFLGNTGGKARKIVDLPLIVESNETATIQEVHIMLGHYIFEKVEDIIIKKK